MFSDSALNIKCPCLSNEQGELSVLHLEGFLFTCSVLGFVWGDDVFILDRFSKHKSRTATPVMCSRVLCPPLFSRVTFAFVSLSSSALSLCGISHGLADISTFLCSLCYPIYWWRPSSCPALSSRALSRYSSLYFLFSFCSFPCISVNSSDLLQFLVPSC